MLAQVKVTHLSVIETAKRTGLHPEILIQLVKAGLISGNAAGDLSMCNIEQAVRITEELNFARATVEGNPILVSDAADKYGFDRNSIYNWIKNGWVTVLQEEPRRRVNEGDVAFAQALAGMQGGIVAGRAVFPARPRTGRPPKRK